jgi:hypothetical protein
VAAIWCGFFFEEAVGIDCPWTWSEFAPIADCFAQLNPLIS